jgi:hypothetical protein
VEVGLVTTVTNVLITLNTGYLLLADQMLLSQEPLNEMIVVVYVVAIVAPAAAVVVAVYVAPAAAVVAVYVALAAAVVYVAAATYITCTCMFLSPYAVLFPLVP